MVIYCQLKRFIVRRFAALSQGKLLPIVFRRHFSQGAVSAYDAARASAQYHPQSLHSTQAAVSAHSVIAQPIVTPPAAADSYSKVDPSSFSPAFEVRPAVSAPPLSESYYQETKLEEAAPHGVENDPYGSIHLPHVEPYASTRGTQHVLVEEEVPRLVEDEDEYYIIPSISAPSAAVPDIAAPAAEVNEIRSTQHIVVDLGSSTIPDRASESVEEPPVMPPPRPPPPPPRILPPTDALPAPTAPTAPSMPTASAPTSSSTHLSEPLPWTPAETAENGHADSGFVAPVVVSAAHMLPEENDADEAVAVVESSSSAATDTSGTIHSDPVELPDAPTSLPDILFPAVPTAAVSRGRVAYSDGEVEVAERTVAMSGRGGDHGMSASSPTHHVSATPAGAPAPFPLPSGGEAIAYGAPVLDNAEGTLAVMNAAVAVPISVDTRTRTSNAHRMVSPIMLFAVC
jgi:hypothetical protein